MHNAVLIRIRALTGVRDTAFYHRVARRIHEYPTRSVRLQLSKRRVLVQHLRGCRGLLRHKAPCHDSQYVLRQDSAFPLVHLLSWSEDVSLDVLPTLKERAVAPEWSLFGTFLLFSPQSLMWLSIRVSHNLMTFPVMSMYPLESGLRFEICLTFRAGL